MKITGFRPLIVSRDAEAVIRVFEDLGFERQHLKTDIEGGNVASCALKDADGHYINIASSQVIPQDLSSIAVNVDNFREAYDFFMSHGFTNPRGDKVTDTSSSKSTMLISPSGFAVTISEHIK